MNGAGGDPALFWLRPVFGVRLRLSRRRPLAKTSYIIETGPFTLTGTANYFDGYNLSAEDQTGPGTKGDGGLNPGYVPDDVSDYVTVDLVASFEASERFTFYVNALNILDDLPPIDPVTYGAHLYNPVQGGLGILGRQFRAGVRVGF